MNVIVTGGNGFIGSNIVRKLLKEGHSVFVLSNHTNNIEDLLKDIKYSELSSNQLKEFLYPLEDKILEFSPDVLIHCAWSGGSSYEQINSTSQFTDNISIGIKLLNTLKQIPNKKVKFIGIGSFSEYGNLIEPAKETLQENPINLYGLSKYTFKRLSKLFCDDNNINWVWARPCYVYGSGDVKTRLIPRLVKSFKNNENIELDECLSTLDYLHIDDFTELLYSLLKSKETGVFNICSGKQYKLKKIIETIQQLLISNSIVTYSSKNDKKYLPKFICGDNSKIMNLFQYKMKHDIESGLKQIIYEK